MKRLIEVLILVAVTAAPAYAQTNPNDVYVGAQYQVSWDHVGTGWNTDLSLSGFEVQIGVAAPFRLPTTARSTAPLTCPATPSSFSVAVKAFNNGGIVVADFSPAQSVVVNCISRPPVAPPAPTGVRIIRTVTTVILQKPDGSIAITENTTGTRYEVIK